MVNLQAPIDPNFPWESPLPCLGLFSEQGKVGLMGSQWEHDQVSIKSIEAMPDRKACLKHKNTWRPKLKLHEITRHSALDVSLFAWYSDHALAVPARFFSIHWHQSRGATEHNQGWKRKQKIQHTNIFRILNIVRCDEWCMSISTHESCSTCIYPFQDSSNLPCLTQHLYNQKIRAAAKSKRQKTTPLLCECSP